jgi:hypothetical protein
VNVLLHAFSAQCGSMRSIKCRRRTSATRTDITTLQRAALAVHTRAARRQRAVPSATSVVNRDILRATALCKARALHAGLTLCIVPTTTTMLRRQLVAGIVPVTNVATVDILQEIVRNEIRTHKYMTRNSPKTNKANKETEGLCQRKATDSRRANMSRESKEADRDDDSGNDAVSTDRDDDDNNSAPTKLSPAMEHFVSSLQEDEQGQSRQVSSDNPMKSPWGLLLVVLAIMCFFLGLQLYDYYSTVV